VVTSVEITDWRGGDTTYFPALVQETAKNFDVAEISADKAYLTKEQRRVGRAGRGDAVRPLQEEHQAGTQPRHRLGADVSPLRVGPQDLRRSLPPALQRRDPFSMIKG